MLILFLVGIPATGAWAASKPPAVGSAAWLLKAGRDAYDEGRYAQSAQYAERLLGARRPASAVQRHEALNLLGQAQTKLGDHGQALEALSRAEHLARRKNLHKGLALTYTFIGDAYERMKRHPVALEYYRKGLAQLRLPGDWREARLALMQIGDIHVVAGDFDEAQRAYERGLAYAEQAGDAGSVAQNLDYIGFFYRSIGDAAKAISAHERALQYAARVPGRVGRARAAARAYNHLGLSQQLAAQAESGAAALALLRRAVESEERGLRLAREAQDRWRQGYVLRALSMLHRQLGELDPSTGEEQLRHSARYAERALTLAREMSNPEWEGRALHMLAVAQARSGDCSAAAATMEQALAIWERIGDTYSRGVGLRLRGEEIAERRGDAAGARDDYLLALEAFRGVEARDDIAQVHFRLSGTLAQQGNRAAAIYFGKQAVNTIQGMRDRLRNLDRESQQAFVTGKASIYRGVADLLIEEGRLPEAQQVLLMLKEEEFFDFVRRDSRQDTRTTQASYTAQEQEWHDRYQEISGRIAALGSEQDALRRKARRGLSDVERARYEDLRKDLAVARQAFERSVAEFLREMATADAERNREVGAKNLADLGALRGTLESLGHDAVTLHYLMGESKLRIILTTRAVQLAREHQITARELNRKIQRFRQLLQDPRLDPLGLARDLYDILIRPIAEDLKQAKARTLMLSLDGALRYLPFAALHDGARYLVEDFQLAIYTEAAKDKLKDNPQPEWKLAGLGLTRKIEGFSRLPAVKQELEGIVRTAPDRGILPGEVHLDDAFTASRMRDALDRGYPVLHIASHFVFSPGTESDSFLLLGDGTRLTLREIKDGDFDFRNVDLITLSACETAIGGGKDANGQEIEGFGALTQKQGAKGVIATLWPVADQSTGLLMQRLYRFREQQGMTKAEGLREAQVAFIRGTQLRPATLDAEPGANREVADAGPDVPGRDPSRPYAHPFYWAPFILMGNWL
jgi:CHAT domain-containing protein/tetratricopeptide (TPR) repeat protein